MCIDASYRSDALGDQRRHANLQDGTVHRPDFWISTTDGLPIHSSGSLPAEAYVGVMSTVGLDIGITAGGALAWGVFAPTAGPRRGALAGTYAGASGAVGVGVGVGANLLFGGTGRSTRFNRFHSRGRRHKPLSWSFEFYPYIGAIETAQHSMWSPSTRSTKNNAAKPLGIEPPEDVR